jgi:hypothetical protein
MVSGKLLGIAFSVDFLHSLVLTDFSIKVRMNLFLSNFTSVSFTNTRSSGCGLENREYGYRVPSHLPPDTLYPQKLELTSPTSGGRLVGVVRSRTKVTEFSLFYLI